tara:strand:+ start:4158 stop:5693 length:1536 start_codon:yes stop_codon:yes gene_type:complete
MSDVFESSLYSDSASSNVTSGLRYGPGLDTGDLRRKFNFGDRVSELSMAQDPFFRFVSKVAKKPTDDPSFKYTEKRGSWHKRYAYVSNHGTTAPGAINGGNATVTHTNVDAGDTYYFTMISDYLSDGNKQNVYGQSTNEISPGDAGTKPAFFVPGQMVKIPYSTSVTAGSWDDSAADSASRPNSYLIAKIKSVTGISNTGVDLECEIVSKGSAGADFELMSYSAYNNALDAVDISGKSIHDYLEPKRAYVIGTAFAEGSGYPESWKDQPYSTGYGQTQIWKTSMAMTNTARATGLKYEQNEWARIWKEKLVEHKWDIEQSLLFGSQYSTSDVNYTQGAVDFISTYGNSFTWSVNKGQDDFLNDMSNYLDPRYNAGGATVFFCRTDVYNWLHKLDGYFANNLEQSANYRYDFAVQGKSKNLGVDITKISTVYGDMNVARNIHLDGTNIAMLGIDMSHCAYRPLVGNGLNRDTSVYVGVQTLENSGVDRRVDMILTEAGMQWEMPESHAVWVG